MPKGEKIGLRASSGKRNIRFGLVSVGIGMSPVREEGKARVAARMVDPDTLEGVKRVWMVGDKIIADPVKAYPVATGGQVVLEADEVPRPANTDEIDLSANVAASSISAAMIEKSYLIWPQEGAVEGFGVLLAYCRDNDRALVGTTTDGGTSKGFVIRYDDSLGTLVAQLLAYEANVRWSHVETVKSYMAEQAEPADALLDMAATLFDGLPDEFDWSTVTDDYGDALERAIAAKAQGVKIEVEADDSTRVEQADSLMAALRASVDGAPAPAKKRAKVAA